MNFNKYVLFLFKFLLLCIAFYLIDSPFISLRITDYLTREVYLKLTGYIFQLLLAVSLIAFFSISTKIVKIFFLCIFLLSSIAYRTYFNAMGTPLLFSDFVTLFEAREQIDNAFLAYSSAFYNSLLIHLPILLVYFLFPSLKLKWVGSVVVIIIYFLVLVIFTVSLVNTQGRGLLGRPGFIQTVVQSIVYSYSRIEGEDVNKALIPSERPDYQEFQVDDVGLSTVIMVIDESISWDLIDLNSNLGVTPILRDYSIKNVTNFGKAISYANCSDISNASIRKFVRYGEEEQDLLGTKNIYLWEVAKKAGYKPYLLDIQKNGIGHNYFTAEELSGVDVVDVKGISDKDIVDVILRIQEEAPVAEKQFFLLIKGGAHFPYIKIDPKMPEIFTPFMPTSSMTDSSIVEIFNSYRNLAHFQTNLFFEQVLQKLDYKKSLALVYTSDHGQSFKNIRHQATHCNTKNPELTEGTVPFLIIAPENIHQRDVIAELANNARVKSHYLIPAVLMDIFGYQSVDIAEFTQYQKLLEPNNKNRFIYKRAVPLFAAEADKYEVEDIEVLNLQNQDINNF